MGLSEKRGKSKQIQAVVSAAMVPSAVAVVKGFSGMSWNLLCCLVVNSHITRPHSGH